MAESQVKQIKFHAQLRVKETIEGVASADSAEVDNNDLNAAQSVLTVTTTPLIASFRWSGREYTLGTGDTSIDLTSLLGTQDSIDATGDKVQYLHIITGADNVGVLTVKPGGSNPYNLFGSSNEIDLGADVEILARLGETLDDVAAGAKIIELSGTAADTVSIGICTGPIAGT